MDYIGIDIGSTAAKVYVGAEEKSWAFTLPTGWSSRETARLIAERLQAKGLEVWNKEQVRIASTGYGRQAVEYADEIITEITCHGKGGSYLAEGDCTVIDVGGQDTKIICMEQGSVQDFLMNDKCAAGTGKFVEVMANRLNVELEELFTLAAGGKTLAISSLCTVFAESEVINLLSSGHSREEVAAGIVDSVAAKVAGMASKRPLAERVILTGGLSQNPFFAQVLGQKLHRQIILHPQARYAGAIGAAWLAKYRHLAKANQ